MEFTAISRLEKGKLVVEVNAPQADKTTQYAYYLCEESRGVLVKQKYIGSNTFSFDLPDSGQYFVKVYIRHWPNGKWCDCVVTSKNTNVVTFYPKKALTYEQLDGENFRSPDGMIYDILWNGVHYEFYIHNRSDSSDAVIFGSGALGSPQKPHFNRISWGTEIVATTIYYFDPTLYLGQIKLGWGYGTNDRWYLADIAALLRKILDKLNIPTSNTLFYGSSAGGFMSMGLAAMLHGRATVINPQFIVENYWPQWVNPTKKVCLKAGESFLTERTHVIAIFEKEGYFPPIHLVQNIRADHDIKNQVECFLDELIQRETPYTDFFRIEFYSDAGGHGVMPPKEMCLRHIAEDLARPLTDAPD